MSEKRKNSDEKETQASAAKRARLDHYTIITDGGGSIRRLATNLWLESQPKVGTNVITLTDDRYPPKDCCYGKFVHINSGQYRFGYELKEIRDGTYHINNTPIRGVYGVLNERLAEEFTIKKGKLDGLYRFYSWPGCNIFPSYPFDNGKLDDQCPRIGGLLYHRIGQPARVEPSLEISCVFHEGLLHGAIIIKDHSGEGEARIEMKEGKREGLSVFLQGRKKYYYQYRDDTLYEHKIMEGVQIQEWSSNGCRGSLLPINKERNCSVLACHYKVIIPASGGETETHYNINDEITHTIPLLNGLRHGRMEWMQNGTKITQEYREGKAWGQWTEERHGKIMTIFSYHRGKKEGRFFSSSEIVKEQYFEEDKAHGVQKEHIIVSYYFQGQQEKDLSKFAHLAQEVKTAIPSDIKVGPSDIILCYLAPLQEEIYSVMGLKWPGADANDL